MGSREDPPREARRPSTGDHNQQDLEEEWEPTPFNFIFPPSVLISSDPPAPKPSLDLNLCASGGSLPPASSSAPQMEIGNSELEAKIAPLGHNSDLDVENEVLETVNVCVGLGLSGIHGYQP
ncbi:hypothetical protein L1987_36052 [Smallanthus sonchifolius]|uniref:Uncharacterized protein n=1 Tax=Smallanthus sonchifolius TaxID=185202 RepID=A0ACB9HC41_9ASTR|nr:hypothetical protein L1987_36052 [Smallanthus sonchifolius]